MLKKAILIIAVLYSCILAAICLISLEDVPKVNLTHIDKLFHFGTYAMLTFLWFAGFRYSLKKEKTQAIFYATLFSILFGIVIEVLQHTLTTYRSMDVFDVIANTLGALLAAFLLWVTNKIPVKN